MAGFGRSRQHTSRAKRRTPFVLLALFALFLQAFVVQTHVHGYAPALAGYERAETGDAHAAAHVTAADDHQRSCPICQALAAGGAATLPDAGYAVSAQASTIAAIVALSVAPRSHTHSWQSRAPPIVL